MTYKVYASTGLFKPSKYEESVEYIAVMKVEAESEQEAIDKAKSNPENRKYLKHKYWSARKI